MSQFLSFPWLVGLLAVAIAVGLGIRAAQPRRDGPHRKNWDPAPGPSDGPLLSGGKTSDDGDGGGD